jgi:exodeoxyribonuclease VII large subunit
LEQQKPVLSISQLTAQLRDTLATDFDSVTVGGEISSCTRPKSGHIYLTLKDKDAQMLAVIWKGVASQIRFELADGMDVICQGGIDIYPPRGSYQLIIRHIEPLGVGALQLAFKQLYERLSKEGLFDAKHKKPIPAFPKSIAIITSPTGAAIHDFMQIALRRWPSIPILLIPAKVQGQGSVADIVKGIRLAHQLRERPDVLIVGRGGGSIEDLWSFNEEAVVRAIFASEIPVVSAVGHEVDVTLSDLVADFRALTPSEAAEHVVPNAPELLRILDMTQSRLAKLLLAQVQLARERLERLASSRIMLRPLSKVQDLAHMLDDREIRLQKNAQRKLEQARNVLASASARLHSLSPLNVLKRGYSVTQNTDGLVIRDADSVATGDTISTRLESGTLKSKVI